MKDMFCSAVQYQLTQIFEIYFDIYIYIHSQRFIWNLKMMVSKRNLLSKKGLKISGSMLNFRDVYTYIYIYIYIHVPSILSQAKGPMKNGKKNIATSPKRGHNGNNFPSDGEVPSEWTLCMMVMVEWSQKRCVGYFRWGWLQTPEVMIDV